MGSRQVVLHPLSTSNHNLSNTVIPSILVVLHPLSTSNHNKLYENTIKQIVVLHPLSTSNHNRSGETNNREDVVLHPLSTSNHNNVKKIMRLTPLYCILFLHQTTTDALHPPKKRSCIASSFYIKPQRGGLLRHRGRCCIASSFYIKPQQHGKTHILVDSCIASSFYIKPQRKFSTRPVGKVVLHPLSTSNHNPRTPDTLIFGHLTASRHDTKRGGVHRGSRFDAVFTFSTNIRKIIFTEIRRCMSVQRAGARLRSDSSEANI